MKFLISLAAIAALAVPATADAHNQHRPNARAAATVGHPAVTVTWTWVPATRVFRAHWSHPVHGRDFGPNRPAARTHNNARWVPGHWVGYGRNRHWVAGRWVRRAPAHSRHR